MTTVTVKDLLDFAKTKNPEDRVNMRRNYSYSECGCLMVQYGKEKFPDLSEFGCGLRSWQANSWVKTHATIENDLNISSLGFDLHDQYKYQEVVEILEKYLENEQKIAQIG
jgi:hypothetical protein